MKFGTISYLPSSEMLCTQILPLFLEKKLLPLSWTFVSFDTWSPLKLFCTTIYPLIIYVALLLQFFPCSTWRMRQKDRAKCPWVQLYGTWWRHCHILSMSEYAQEKKSGWGRQERKNVVEDEYMGEQCRKPLVWIDCSFERKWITSHHHRVLI